MPEKCTDNPRDCPLLPRVAALERANEQHSKTHAGMYDRIRELEKSDAVQDAHYTAIMDKLDAMNAKLEVLESKPGKRWESLVEKAIWAVCAAVIAFLLGRLGLRVTNNPKFALQEKLLEPLRF